MEDPAETGLYEQESLFDHLVYTLSVRYLYLYLDIVFGTLVFFLIFMGCAGVVFRFVKMRG